MIGSKKLFEGEMSNRQALTSADYERAEKLIPANRARLVPGGSVKPRWIEGGARFWYYREGADSDQFQLVDPAAGTRAPAFDHRRLAEALAGASEQHVDHTALPFRSIEFARGAVEFDAFGARWCCSLSNYACIKLEGHQRPNPMEVRSPDGKSSVFLDGHDLWLRTLATGEARRLTDDGTAERPYASPPDCLSFAVLARKFGLPHLPPIVAWSPDSARLLTHRTDQRDIRTTHLVEAAPADGGPPKLHTYRYAYPGDAAFPKAEPVVFDIAGGGKLMAEGPPIPMPVASPLTFGRMWWSHDSRLVYFLEQDRTHTAIRLKRFDPVTGDVVVLIEERGEPLVDVGQFEGGKPIVAVIDGGQRVIWYSQRDGWGHLYLYDLATGEPPLQLTRGESAAQQILRIDEATRRVYFLASGLVGQDVYRRQVCRVGLDGRDFERLGEDDLDHQVNIPPNQDYYVDTASAVDAPPVITVRDWAGKVLAPLEVADVSRLLSLGWRMPERFCVKAADGETDIYGVLYLPPDLNQSRRYPVLDHVYPGPQTNRVKPSFGEAIPLYDAESLASLGFVVVAVDGRGTPGRSRAFHEASLGHLDKAGFLEDHVAALRQLAETRPWMDLDRVGVFGTSGGGFATVRAMCDYPEFYKVGVSICGNHEQRFYQLSWGETYLGPPDNNEGYVRASNVAIADRLEGKLLLIHGEMDDNVYPQLTLRLVDRLIAANKDFDLLIIPGAEHLFVGYLPYLFRKKWDYFVRNLLGAEPPGGYRLADIHPNIDSLFG